MMMGQSKKLANSRVVLIAGPRQRQLVKSWMIADTTINVTLPKNVSMNRQRRMATIMTIAFVGIA